MIVPVSRPWQTVQDFIAAAKKKDAVISSGSVGVGSAVHIAAEKFRIAAEPRRRMCRIAAAPR